MKNDINFVKREVETILRSKLMTKINEFEDNIAIVLSSEIPDYDASMCSDDYKTMDEHDILILEAVNKIIESEIKVLFDNVKESD